MKKITVKLEKDIYIAEDLSEFDNEKDCLRYEAIGLNGAKQCTNCDYSGKVTVSEDTTGSGLAMGSTRIAREWQEDCPECGGKGYLERTVIYK